MKVLMSAYACEPGKGSEPGAGWAWTRAAALDNEVWVMTRENNREAIEGALRMEPNLRLTPIYLDLPKWARWWKRGGVGLRLYYVIWQGLARRRAKQVHAQIHFDVAHHITFAVDWLPAGVVGLQGLPSVWGPVGGSAEFQWRLRPWLGWRGVLGEVARIVLGGAARLIFGTWTVSRAAVVVAQNHEVADRFASSNPRIEPNVAVPPASLGRPPEIKSLPGLRTALFVGRLTAWKGIRLAVETIAQPALESWNLAVYGAGPESARAMKLAVRLGVESRVEFLGHRPREEVLNAYNTADALLFPSMHDSAGWAVAEAISVGLPVVCLDLCGPRVILERSGLGIAVPIDRKTPARLASALGQVRRIDPSQTATSSVGNDRLPILLREWFFDATSAVATPPGPKLPA